MDEPFGAVDPVQRRALQGEFRRLQQELCKTVVFVTHDVDEAVRLGDRIAVMRHGGRIVQFASPATLLAQPRDGFVAAFLGATRGLELLSLRSAADVPADPVELVDTGGWRLDTDDAGRPTDWLSTDGRADAILAEPVGPTNSLRDLLESAISSPARAAVRVDDGGVLIGLVPFSALEDHLPAPQQAVAEGAR
jgi:osmoprotectant transport system ATP-binding protein